MKENEKAFLDLANQGIFKVYKNGNIYKCKRSCRMWNGEYRDCKPRLMNRITNNGYMQIFFRYNGEKKYIRNHRAVWLYFNGEIPEGLEINHENSNRSDNRLSNLELVTRSGNILHGFKKGFKNAVGENNSNAKLTEKKVLEIRKLLKEGVLQYVIAKMFDVSKMTITAINTGRNWSYVV